MRRIHTGKKPFSCLYCTESFRIVTELKEHITAHREEMLHANADSISSSNNVEKHKLPESGENIYNCLECEKSFPRSSNLKRHLKYMHCSEGKIYNCLECEKSFPGTISLKMHVKYAHNTDKADQNEPMIYICTSCKSPYPSSSDLQKHIKIHKVQKSYQHQCSECNKSFSMAINLNQHMTVAHGATHNKGFVHNMPCTEAKSLNNHIGLHHKGEKPYKCTECVSSFSVYPRETFKRSHQR